MYTDFTYKSRWKVYPWRNIFSEMKSLVRHMTLISDKRKTGFAEMT